MVCSVAGTPGAIVGRGFQSVTPAKLKPLNVMGEATDPTVGGGSISLPVP
jgi:hypothetical protein